MAGEALVLVMEAGGGVVEVDPGLDVGGMLVVREDDVEAVGTVEVGAGMESTPPEHAARSKGRDDRREPNFTARRVFGLHGGPHRAPVSAHAVAFGALSLGEGNLA